MGTTDELIQLWADFHNSAFRLAKEKAANQNTQNDGSLNAIIWQNHLTEKDIAKHFSKDQFIVQLWKETNVCNNIITITAASIKYQKPFIRKIAERFDELYARGVPAALHGC